MFCVMYDCRLANDCAKVSFVFPDLEYVCTLHLHAQMFLQVVVPLLRVATHTSVTDSLQSYFSNPFLAFLFAKLKLEVLAAAVGLLLSVAEAPWVVPSEGDNSSSVGDGSARAGSSGIPASVIAPWQPKDWLDVVEPCVCLLYEMTERFQVCVMLCHHGENCQWSENVSRMY